MAAVGLPLVLFSTPFASIAVVWQILGTVRPAKIGMGVMTMDGGGDDFKYEGNLVQPSASSPPYAFVEIFWKDSRKLEVQLCVGL